MSTRPAKRRVRGARGTTLVEALLAFLALSFGALALMRIQSDLRLGAETARQRAEAVRIAEDDIEQLRSFVSIAASPTGRSYADVISATRTISPSTGSAGSAEFTLDRRVRDAGVASACEVTVSVGWQDGGGRPQRVALASMIAANDPALGAALALVPAGGPPAVAGAP